MAYTIAIVGAGTAGLASALLLDRAGHSVTVFERFSTPRPHGAGLLLQPTGLACLAAMGLHEKVIKFGARVENLSGRTINGRPVFDLAYKDLDQAYTGLGIHRGALFSLLYEACLAQGVTFRTNFVVVDAPRAPAGRRNILRDAGETVGPFDLVVDASGFQSPLRMRYAGTRSVRPYPYGALWGIVRDPKQGFCGRVLQQKYDGAGVMIGVLPVGRQPDFRGTFAAFFWSLPVDSYRQWQRDGMDAWKRRVTALWPETQPLVEQFARPEDLTMAHYGDIILKHWHGPGMVFLGDAAHASSPQLGQGANLALIDAVTLAGVLADHAGLDPALEAFSQLRRDHIRFYQFASRWLTPFFQSNSALAGTVRDMTFSTAQKLPWVRRQMLATLAGIKTGPFSNLDPGQWSKRYALTRGM